MRNEDEVGIILPGSTIPKPELNLGLRMIDIQLLGLLDNAQGCSICNNTKVRGLTERSFSKSKNLDIQYYKNRWPKLVILQLFEPDLYLLRL